MPWTEAVRISGTGLMYERPIFLVNKSGVFSFFTPPAYNSEGADFPELVPAGLSLSCSGFYTSDAGVLIRFYQNTIFNKEEKTQAPSLCRYEPVTRQIIPIVFPADFGLPSYAQLISFSYSDKWFACFKTEETTSVDFKYFSFSEIKDISAGKYREISAEAFMRKTSPLILESAVFDKLIKNGEEAFSNLLKSIEEESVKIEYCNAYAESFTTYIKNNSQTEYAADTEHEAFAVKTKAPKTGEISEAILLENGKLYANIKGSDKTAVKKLPPLPERFVYTYFAPCGNFIIAGWEEQDFFKVGRAGFVLFDFNAES